MSVDCGAPTCSKLPVTQWSHVAVGCTSEDDPAAICSSRCSCLAAVSYSMSLNVTMSYRERTHKGYACVECSKAEGMKLPVGAATRACHCARP
eukprot:5257-Chlamydomonas_euryale.AAC.4